MDYKNLLTTLKRHNFVIFSYGDVRSFFPQEALATVRKELYRWNKKGWIRTLKNGIYEPVLLADSYCPDFYLANRLYSPSYVSLEAALSHYSVIPEVSMAVTSVSTKPTRSFKNEHGLFIYRTIRPRAFTGYYIEKMSGIDVLVAEPEKALVDFLYFKHRGGEAFDFEQERFDKSKIARMSRKKLKLYAGLFNLDLRSLYAYA